MHSLINNESLKLEIYIYPNHVFFYSNKPDLYLYFWSAVTMGLVKSPNCWFVRRYGLVPSANIFLRIPRNKRQTWSFLIVAGKIYEAEVDCESN